MVYCSSFRHIRSLPYYSNSSQFTDMLLIFSTAFSLTATARPSLLYWRGRAKHNDGGDHLESISDNGPNALVSAGTLSGSLIFSGERFPTSRILCFSFSYLKAGITPSNIEAEGAAALPREHDAPVNWGRSRRLKGTGSRNPIQKGEDYSVERQRERRRGHASQGALNSAKRLLKPLEKIYVGHAGK